MRKSKYTKFDLEEAIKSSTTWSEVCRKLGIKPATGAQTYLKKKALSFEMDTIHFLGQAWSKGKNFFKRPIAEYLTIDGKFIGSDALKKRLLREGIKSHKCENCNLTIWCKNPVPIELHHINGNRNDNRLENLQILCCNCHALTDNHSGEKNREVAKRQTHCF